MTSEFFQNLARWKVEQGGTAAVLPYPCYDNFSLVGVFTASTSAARRSALQQARQIPTTRCRQVAD
jgi:hypothetical protein